jgi:hypothetical protein
MIAARLDHLVITAPTLEEGCAWVRARLGVEPGPGGKHPRMGTHNRLLGLGPDCYLEVLAVDPGAGPPEFPRWFRLDERRNQPPRLAAWVARTVDIRAAARLDPAYAHIEPMTRGQLRWEITLPDGGALPFGGIAPLLIQWHTQPIPAASLPDSGCRLAGLSGFHPQPGKIQRLLASLGCPEACQVQRPRGDNPPTLVAAFETPSGPASLDDSL